MYANPSKNEYEAKVNRVRKHFGSGVEIGGYNSRDLIKLNALDAQREADEPRATEARPLNEAATRLRATYERKMKAWRIITERRDLLAKNRPLHLLNGIAPEWLDLVEMPAPTGSFSTVAEYDASNAQEAAIATDLETRAQKLASYVAVWEQSPPDQRNLSIIFKLADRIDKLEQGAG